ncbi:hypothetical protein ETD85_08210 [Nonomuraea zeae]|uniref:Uncharacterized protein n=1 Tax=Nonomuraea zeae TaxID=1642303 RepID=A0A5S4GXS9_9ACTN|nr:hypothetical protein ETD85_08210 [Nonomuraea zeae]
MSKSDRLHVIVRSDAPMLLLGPKVGGEGALAGVQFQSSVGVRLTQVGDDGRPGHGEPCESKQVAGRQRLDGVHEVVDHVSLACPLGQVGHRRSRGDAAWRVTLFAGYGSSLAIGSALSRRFDDIPAADAPLRLAAFPPVTRWLRGHRRRHWSPLTLYCVVDSAWIGRYGGGIISALSRSLAGGG